MTTPRLPEVTAVASATASAAAAVAVGSRRRAPSPDQAPAVLSGAIAEALDKIGAKGEPLDLVISIALRGAQVYVLGHAGHKALTEPVRAVLEAVRTVVESQRTPP